IIYNQVKIADATVYHADVANAKVMEFLANQRSITDVIADARINVIESTFSVIDRGLEKVTSKLGIAGDMVRELLSGFIRLALSPFFKAVYGTQGGGGFGGFGLPGMGGGPGGTPPFSGFSSLIPGLGGNNSALSPIVTGAGGPLSEAQRQAIYGGLPPVLAGGVSPGAGLGLMGSIGTMLPFIGASAGSLLGGQSRFGSILGGVGGALLGGAAGVALLGGSGAAVFGTGGALSGLGGIAGLLSNPFTIGAGAALAVAAIIMARNAR